MVSSRYCEMSYKVGNRWQKGWDNSNLQSRPLLDDNTIPNVKQVWLISIRHCLSSSSRATPLPDMTQHERWKGEARSITATSLPVVLLCDYYYYWSYWSTMIGRPCHVTLAFSVIQYQAAKSPQLPVHHHCLCWSRLKWWGFGVNQATDHSLLESGGLLCLPFGSNESEFVWRTWTNQQPRGQEGLRLRHKCGSCWCTSGSCWHNLPQFSNMHHRV